MLTGQYMNLLEENLTEKAQKGLLRKKELW